MNTQTAKQRKSSNTDQTPGSEQVPITFTKFDDVPDVAACKRLLDELAVADADISAKITACERAMLESAQARAPDGDKVGAGLAAARGEKQQEDKTFSAQLNKLRWRQGDVRAALAQIRAEVDRMRERESIQFCQSLRPELGAVADKMIEALMMIDQAIAAENELQKRAALAGFEYKLPILPDPMGRMNDDTGSHAFYAYRELQVISGRAFKYDATTRMNVPDGEKTKDDVRRAGGQTEVLCLCDSVVGKGGDVVSVPTADVDLFKRLGFVDDNRAQVEYGKAQLRLATADAARTMNVEHRGVF